MDIPRFAPKNDSRIVLSVVELSASSESVSQVETGSTRLTSSSTTISTAKSPSKPVIWMNQLIDQQQKRLGFRSTFQGRVYNFLERPTTIWSMLYHCTSFLMLFVCLVFSILSTVRGFVEVSIVALFWMEIGLVVFFGSEFAIRVWSAGFQGKFVGFWGRIRYMRNPTCIIDLIVVCASTYVILHGSSGQVFAASAIRGIRFLQLLRMVRIDRQGGTWRLLGSVVYCHRKELVTTLYIGFLGLIFSSYFLYLAEKDVDNGSDSTDFESYADAIWWGVVTYTTIGYGDKVPRTWTGRAITCVFSLVIISFVTLPSGILGSGFALKVQQKMRHKQFTKQFPAAAKLIQCAWRCYTVDKANPSEITWRIHMKRPNLSEKRGVIRLRRKFRSETSTPVLKKKSLRHSVGIDNFALDDISIKDSFGGSSSSVSMPPSSPGSDSVFDSPRLSYQLSEAEKTAIRAVRNMKFLVAKKNFLKSKKPYDVQDVIDQYSQGHTNMMFSLRELQKKLELTIGKPLAEDSPSLSTRLRKIEEKFHYIDKKLDSILEILNRRRHE